MPRVVTPIALGAEVRSVSEVRCDAAVASPLIGKDFEFYHDKGGPLVDNSDELAVEAMLDGLGKICRGTHRKLVEESMEVFPLYDGDDLYGAIQRGTHHFYRVKDGEVGNLTTEAKFTHLWIIEDGEWKLKRVLSFDHQRM